MDWKNAAPTNARSGEKRTIHLPSANNNSCRRAVARIEKSRRERCAQPAFAAHCTLRAHVRPHICAQIHSHVRAFSGTDLLRAMDTNPLKYPKSVTVDFRKLEVSLPGFCTAKWRMHHAAAVACLPFLRHNSLAWCLVQLCSLERILKRAALVKVLKYYKGE